MKKSIMKAVLCCVLGSKFFEVMQYTFINNIDKNPIFPNLGEIYQSRSFFWINQIWICWSKNYLLIHVGRISELFYKVFMVLLSIPICYCMDKSDHSLYHNNYLCVSQKKVMQVWNMTQLKHFWLIILM